MVSENFNAKTARACDSCIRKRARWYCAADDAFLCQACDASVHTANPLALRHQRVRLKTASMKQLSLEPSWHQGFTKKPRTPRHGKHHRRTNSDKAIRNPLHLVPEMGPDENSYEENEEQAQLVYRVPIFDPLAAELCLSGNSSEGAICNDDKYKMGMLSESGNYDGNISLHGFYSSDMDLEDFAADVENLLGKGLDDEESFDMETLGFLDFAEKLDSMELTSSRSTTGKVKLEKEEEMEGTMGNYQIDAEIDMNRETFELNFDDYDEYPANYEENDDKAGVGGRALILKKEECEMGNVKQQKEEKKILLALDYEGVIAAWADQKSAWTTGERLDLDTNDCWPDCMVGYFLLLHTLAYISSKKNSFILEPSKYNVD